MLRTLRRLAFLVVVALAGGCVERQFFIDSNPPAAQVFRNGELIGTTPCEVSFVYYGEYEFTLVKDGYETLVVREKIRTPWYEVPPLDFFTENVWPFKVRDSRRLNFTMQPRRATSTADVLMRAEQLRGQGRAIGDVPAAPLPVPVVPPAGPSTPPITVPPRQG